MFVGEREFMATETLRKRIAALTLVFFLTSSVNLYPQPASTVRPVSGSGGVTGIGSISQSLLGAGATQFRPDHNPYLITIPEELGTIEEVYAGSPDQPLIVHIQNAHANYRAQVNIKNILDHLVTNHGFSLLQVEGAVSKLNPDVLKPSYLKEANLKLVDLMMREGRVTGADAFAVETDKAIEYYGIEEKNIYLENLRMFRSIYSHRDQVGNFFVNAHRNIDKISRKLLPPGPLDFTRKKEEFSGDKIDLLDYMVYLNDVSEKMGLLSLKDLKEMVQYPNLVRIMRLRAIEAELDHGKLEKENKSLKGELETKSEKTEAVESIISRLGAREKGTKPRDYFLDLTKVASDANINFIRYPNIRLFAEYLIYQDEIDQHAIFSELKRFEGFLEETLFKTKEAQDFVELIQFSGLLEQYFHLEMSREWLAEYLKDREKN